MSITVCVLVRYLEFLDARSRYAYVGDECGVAFDVKMSSLRGISVCICCGIDID